MSTDFAKSIGGSPTSVAVAAARLGRRAAVVTRVGDDGFGEYVRTVLAERFGVVDGDAFGGALVDGLISGLDPLETVTRANAAGAIVAGRLECSDAMPTRAEIEAVLASATAPGPETIPPGAGAA